jgi:hypothetical protein
MAQPFLTVPDHEVARLVAREFEDALARRGREQPGPFYAATLWVDEVYGYFAFNTADQGDYELRRTRAATYAEHELDGPAFRWYSGDWTTQPERFLSQETTDILAPLTSFVNDDSIELDAVAPVWARWHTIAYEAVRQVRIPTNLPTTPDFLVYVERDDIGLVDNAEDMLRTMSAERFHEAIPAWRRLAVVVRDARDDPAVMARVRQQAAAEAIFPKTPDSMRFPHFPDAAPDEVTAHLRSCGLNWHDLVEWTDRMRRALAIADTALP